MTITLAGTTDDEKSRSSTPSSRRLTHPQPPPHPHRHPYHAVTGGEGVAVTASSGHPGGGAMVGAHDGMGGGPTGASSAFMSSGPVSKVGKKVES